MKNVNRFLERAKQIAQKSNYQQHKHGCVIVYKGRIVATGFNSMSTNPKSSHRFNKIHAEMAALWKLHSRITNKHILYVYREHKNGKMAMSRPCKLCEQMIRVVGISTVIYTVEDGWNIEVYD